MTETPPTPAQIIAQLTRLRDEAQDAAQTCRAYIADHPLGSFWKVQLAARVHTATCLTAALDGMVWKPISDAPRNGTHIRVADFTPGAAGFGWPYGVHQQFETVAHWFDDPENPGFYPSVWSGDSGPLKVTHFQALGLPAPPATEGEV